ncbi:Hsf-type dna-binding protein [Globisporangium polare]
MDQLMFAPRQEPSSPTSSPTNSSSKTKDVAPFLKSLRQILDCEDQRILRWTQDGRAFEIHDLQRMMDVVLPKYFKHAKYTSFQRQLNYFNFRKWTKSKAVVCTFSNPHFVRDQPCLSWRINRKKSTHGGKACAAASSDSVSASATKPKSSKKKASTSHRSPATEMTITLPQNAKISAQTSAFSFPSPTEVYGSVADHLAFDMTSGSFALASTLSATSSALPSDVCFHEPIVLDAQSFDWVDTLYSSLDASVLGLVGKHSSDFDAAGRTVTMPSLYFDPTSAALFDLRL